MYKPRKNRHRTKNKVNILAQITTREKINSTMGIWFKVIFNLHELKLYQ